MLEPKVSKQWKQTQYEKIKEVLNKNESSIKFDACEESNLQKLIKRIISGKAINRDLTLNMELKVDSKDLFVQKWKRDMMLRYLKAVIMLLQSEKCPIKLNVELSDSYRKEFPEKAKLIDQLVLAQSQKTVVASVLSPASSVPRMGRGGF